MRTNISALLIAAILILTLAGCSSNKESIDFDTFLDTTNDLGYEERGTIQSDNESDYIRVYSEDSNYYVTCLIYKEKDVAIKIFDESLEAAKSFEEDGKNDYQFKESGSGNYQKFSMDGKTVNHLDYMVYVRVDNAIIIAASKDNGKADVTEIDTVIKELGY